MKKRFMLFGLAAAMITALLGFSCSGDSRTVVTMWYWDDLVSDDFDVIIREFEQVNPDIRVQKVVTPWATYWTRLQTALPTGSGPDIFWLNHPNTVTYLPTGLVRDLEDWADDINFDNFNPRFSEPFSHNGRRFGLPFMWDSIVLFYNKAIFDKMGVAYPDENWTWDDYYSAAEKLTLREGQNVVHYGAVPNSSMQSGVGPMIYQSGATPFNADRTRIMLNTPQAIDAVQRQLDMINSGFAPTQQVISESSVMALFGSGAVAMSSNLSVRISHFAELMGRDVRIAPLPRQAQQATVFHNIAYAVSEKTRNPDAVRKFISFLASKRAAEIVAHTFAPCFNGMAELTFAEYEWANAGYIPESINYGYPLPIASRNAGSAWTMTENGLAGIFAAAGQVGNQLADLEDQVNAEIAR